jgi:hypothetical protein
VLGLVAKTEVTVLAAIELKDIIVACSSQYTVYSEHLLHLRPGYFAFKDKYQAFMLGKSTTTTVSRSVAFVLRSI